MPEIGKIPVQVKPHIYKTYYPKLGRGFWRVSPAPNLNNLYLWAQAHNYVNKLNTGYSQ